MASSVGVILIGDNPNWALAVALIPLLLFYAGYVVSVKFDKKVVRGGAETTIKAADPTMSWFWQGADGRASLSKFQYWLWTFVVIYAYIAVWLARWIATNHYAGPVNELPDNILAVLGISTGTVLIAKAVTTAQVENGTIVKTRVGAGDSTLGQLLSDDNRNPELAKLQMFLFTFVGVAVYLLGLGGHISDLGDAVNTFKAVDPKETMAKAAALTTFKDVLANFSLPDIDSVFMVLMGISATGYMGKKLITRDPPTLSAITPDAVSLSIASPILITGKSLGGATSGALRIGPKLLQNPVPAAPAAPVAPGAAANPPAAPPANPPGGAVNPPAGAGQAQAVLPPGVEEWTSDRIKLTGAQALGLVAGTYEVTVTVYSVMSNKLTLRIDA